MTRGRTDFSVVRKFILRPYSRAHDPHGFVWTVRETGRTDNRGQTVMSVEVRHGGKLVYMGSGFAGSPLHADDSDDTMAAIVTLACHDAATCSECESSRACAHERTWDVLASHAEALHSEAEARFR
jgi:hypothetical protein